MYLQNKPVNISETVLMFEESFHQFAGADPGIMVGGAWFFFSNAGGLGAALRPPVGPAKPWWEAPEF